MSLRLIIADDHWVVLHGLSALARLEDDLEVVTTCVDGAEVLEALERFRPDVLVMDCTMPRLGGIEAFAEMAERGIRVPTVLLSAGFDDDVLLRGVQLGVQGFVLKEAAASALLDAVRTVGGGGRWMAPELAARAVALATGTDTEDPLSDLTERERDVAIRVVEGLSNKKVASALGISESTVKLHLHRVYRKLDVSNRVQLNLLAQEQGWG